MSRFTYSRWDGTQVVFEMGAGDVLDELSDELLYHGDLNSALRRMMQRGFTDRNGRDVQGMRELMERIRERREQLLAEHDASSPYADIERRLEQVLDKERAGINQLEEDARNSGDARRSELASETATERRMSLDLLPDDLPGKVNSLQSHEWTSPAAEQEFQELMDELRSEILQSQFNQMADAMSNVSPESLARTKDMLNDLNQMMEARERGEDTERMFAEFMDNYGDMFPGNPENLEQLLQMMAQQMAAMSQMLASMTPEQRRQLQELSDALMQDMDLGWQMDRLSSNLRQAFPTLNWDQGQSFSGEGQPMDLPGAASVMSQLGELDQLEQMMSSAMEPADLAEVDPESVRKLLGKDSGDSLEALSQLAKQMSDAGLIDRREGRMELTAAGIRALGRSALNDLFSRLVKDRMGRHSTMAVGLGQERSYETKPYEWGDPFQLNIEKTVRNAVARQGSGTPVHLSPDDFEVERTEAMTRTSTVLAVDMSLSMEFRGNFLPAKKTAMALHALISGQYPNDYLGLVAFGEVAREMTAAQLPEVSWDYTYGTNMQHALALSRQLLSTRSGTKQIIMITDGEPTAHLLPNGHPIFEYPTSPETVRETLAEVMRVTKEGIRINTFVLDVTPGLRRFVETMSRMNSGRAFFTTPDTLGDYVLVDYLDNKRARREGRRSA